MTKIEHRNKAGCRTEGGTGERWWAERGWGVGGANQVDTRTVREVREKPVS